MTPEVPAQRGTGFQRYFHFLTELGARHGVTLVSLTRRDAVPEEEVAALRHAAWPILVFGEASADEPLLARAAARISQRVGRAVRRRLAARRLARAVAKLLMQVRYDVVLLSGKDTYPVLKVVEGLPLVVDLCDATSHRIRGQIARARGVRRAWLRLRLAELRRIERRLVQSTTSLAFASQRDRAALLGSEDRRGIIVPQAIDVSYWQQRVPVGLPATIVFTGVMSYPPNHDAAMFLIREIMPLIVEAVPEAALFVVGKDPLPELVAAASEMPRVTLTGEPKDMRAYFDLATIACAPMRFASGMQFKVLEAMAMRVPVVTTPAAADGLRLGTHRPPVVVADSAQEIADAAVRLLRDRALRARLAERGRRYVERHFTWERSTRLLEGLLYRAIGQPEPREIIDIREEALEQERQPIPREEGEEARDGTDG